VLGFSNLADAERPDVALLVLGDRASSDSAMAIASSSILPGTPFMVIRANAPCIGSTCGQGAFSWTELADLRVACGPGACPPDVKVAPDEWMGDRGPCPGDSGAAAVDEAGQLLGVVLRGRIDKNGHCVDPVFEDAAYIRNRMRQIIDGPR
jgi:hypothetical protein